MSADKYTHTGLRREWVLAARAFSGCLGIRVGSKCPPYQTGTVCFSSTITTNNALAHIPRGCHPRPPIPTIPPHNPPSFSTSLLNAPSRSRTETKGASSRSSIGLNMGGMGEYRNETLITNPQDTSFLSNIIRTVFFLRGIEIVPEQQADTVMFINIDVFGTIRSRTEMHLYNAETLKAQTKLEYFAADRSTHRLLIKPSTEAYEAKYQEKYALWMGPYKTDKNLKPTEGLMADFSDITPYVESSTGSPSSSESPAAEIPNGSRPSNETIR